MLRDRREAGRRLAAALQGRAFKRPVVMALPRGGVPVGYEIAQSAGAPLDVLIVRKLGVPWQPELGMGAIAEDGVRVLNEPLVERLGIDARAVAAETEREAAEADRRARRYRGERPPTSVAGRDVIVVDDGIATGFTARAAVEVLRQRGARRVTIAAPVAPPDSVAALQEIADEVVCLETPEHFMAIGQWYADFHQISDEEVRELLDAPGGGRQPGADPPARAVVVPADGVRLPGTLTAGSDQRGVVVFAHGSGSSRLSPRNLAVADTLHGADLATLLFDLLTDEEGRDRANVFDIPLLASRLVAAVRWLRDDAVVGDRPVGLFGASTGAAAALWAAAELGSDVGAVVSRGGRPDLALQRLAAVTAPTLLIVGERDPAVLGLNREAERALTCRVRLDVVPGAGHLFEEPGALERVATLARQWFADHLTDT